MRKRVERALILEKQRIRRTVMLVKKERLHDDLKLLEKREKQIAFLQRKMLALQRHMAADARRIEGSIRALSRKKETEGAKLQQYQIVIRALQANGKAAQNIGAGRALEMERKRLEELDVVGRMCEELGDKRVRAIIGRKRQLLGKAQRLHKEALALAAESKIAEEMAQNQSRSVHTISEKLRRQHAAHSALMKEKKALLEQEKNFRKQLTHIALRKRGIVQSLRKRA